MNTFVEPALPTAPAARPANGRTTRAGRTAAIARHQCVLLAEDPGPLIAFTLMPLVLMSVIQPMMNLLTRLVPDRVPNGTAQAAAGMAVMFSLFVLKLVGASLLDERAAWHTWDRVRSSPARLGEILFGKAVPMFVFLVGQQVVLFGFAALVYDLRSPAWWRVAVVALVWPVCILALGTGASTLVRTSAQLSAVGDISAVVTTVLGGALVPSAMLPSWMRWVGPATPGYWAMSAYRSALTSPSGTGLARDLLVLAGFAVAGLCAGGWAGRRASGR